MIHIHVSISKKRGIVLDYLKRTWVEISLDSLTHNYYQLRSTLPDHTMFLGVVKGDAYGHGAVEISRHLEKLGAEFLAVSNLEEAEQLRQGGIQLPILLLGYSPASFAEFEANNNIHQEVNSFQYAKELNEALNGTNKKLKIHIKLDTGMSRLGFFAYDRPETIEELERISNMPNLEIEGAFQHFAVADSYSESSQAFTRLQYERFTNMLETMEAHGIHIKIRHCCNSAATLLHSEYAMDLVRPGIAIYGFMPDPCMNNDLNLRPLLSWKTTVSQIKEIDQGITVGYGQTWKAARKSRIATLPVGYADGLNRLLSNQVQFVLNGHKAQQVGRICMDMCMIDITDVPGVHVGDEVEILGNNNISCEAMATKLHTITYEVTCNINKRVPRIYLLDGQEVARLQYII